jgi:hypothetical protein
VSSPTSSLDDAQRSRLARAKARALARGLLGGAEWTDAALGGGALVHDGRDAAVLMADPGEGDPGRGLGPALAWMGKAGLPGRLHLLVDDGGVRPGVIARRVTYFDPSPTVWRVSGAELAPAEPEPFPPVREPSAADLAAVSPLRAAGADLVVEHGAVLAEILGLEVGRVIEGILQVGVGKHDRAASEIMETIRPRDDVLASVVGTVKAHRRSGVTPHLLNRLARERWLRAMVLADPGLVGAASLTPVEPPYPRPNLVAPVPASAAGVCADGSPVVVACSVGVDLDLVPIAADVRARERPRAELVVVLPPRDRYPATVALADRLRRPAQVVALDGDWPT